MNIVAITGNIVNDVEAPRTAGKSEVTDVRIAVKGWGKDDTLFIDVTLWGTIAQTAYKYLKKGSHVGIEGRLSQDSWDDKETGQRRNKIKIVASNLDLGPKPKSDDVKSAEDSSPVEEDVEDIPF